MSKKPTGLDAKSLQARALASIVERDKVKDLVIVHSAEDVVPSTRARLFQFHAVREGDLNGPHYTLVLDEKGEPVDLETLSKREGVEFFAPPKFEIDIEALRPVVEPVQPITIEPAVNDLILKLGSVHQETITVTVPKDTAISRADVYFLADTTGSMSPIIEAVKSGARVILTTLNTLIPDVAFGVGNYRDFPNDANIFQHQLNPTTDINLVDTAIGSWTTGGGGDFCEGQLFALDQLAEPPGGSIGWRSGSKRIIVWFGDWPGHDPICKAISGLSYDITEASVTAKLVAENITVIAISTITDTDAPAGLDDDPNKNVGDYDAAKCPGSGNTGQATRIAQATGGMHQTGVGPDDIVKTIIDLVTVAATVFENIRLSPTGDAAQFVQAISPAAGYNSVSTIQERQLTFTVYFRGVVPCAQIPQVFEGTLDVVADDGVETRVVASKEVTITVPPCQYSYSVKFVCGVQPEQADGETVVPPGVYATEINIHNYTDTAARIEKHVLAVVEKAEPVGREPEHVSRKGRERVALPPNTATMDDCQSIARLVYGGKPPAPLPLTIGFLEIVSPVKLNVTAVYIVASQVVNVAVENIEGKLK